MKQEEGKGNKGTKKPRRGCHIPPGHYLSCPFGFRTDSQHCREVEEILADFEWSVKEKLSKKVVDINDSPSLVLSPLSTPPPLFSSPLSLPSPSSSVYLLSPSPPSSSPPLRSCPSPPSSSSISLPPPPTPPNHVPPFLPPPPPLPNRVPPSFLPPPPPLAPFSAFLLPPPISFPPSFLPPAPFSPSPLRPLAFPAVVSQACPAARFLKVVATTSQVSMTVLQLPDGQLVFPDGNQMQVQNIRPAAVAHPAAMARHTEVAHPAAVARHTEVAHPAAVAHHTEVARPAAVAHHTEVACPAARPAACPGVAAQMTCCSQKRKCDDKPNQPYISKPPNAFMLYLKEQRAVVAAELGVTDSVAVNVIVGKKWHSLTSKQQEKYFLEAHAERRRHEAEHPEWSPLDNYGRKRKRTRQRSTAPSISGASSSQPEGPQGPA